MNHKAYYDPDYTLEEIERHLKKANERRWKIVRADRRVLMDCFTALRKLRQLCLPLIPDVPEDAEVVDVRDNWHNRCLDVVLRHPSFDVVPYGAEVPAFGHVFVQAFEQLPVQPESVLILRGPANQESLDVASRIAESTGLNVVVVPLGIPLEESIEAQERLRLRRAAENYLTESGTAVPPDRNDLSMPALYQRTPSIGVLKEDIAKQYGVCPTCHGLCHMRERRVGGNDICENGHEYPSRDAVPYDPVVKPGDIVADGVKAISAATWDDGSSRDIKADLREAMYAPIMQDNRKAIIPTSCLPDPLCPDCKGTGQYVGLNATEPCLACGGKGQL